MTLLSPQKMEMLSFNGLKTPGSIGKKTQTLSDVSSQPSQNSLFGGVQPSGLGSRQYKGDYLGGFAAGQPLEKKMQLEIP